MPWLEEETASHLGSWYRENHSFWQPRFGNYLRSGSINERAVSTGDDEARMGSIGKAEHSLVAQLLEFGFHERAFRSSAYTLVENNR
jgi:hypothetical protein